MIDIGVYGIFNKLDGKIYIGQSTQLNIRMAQHKSDLKNNRSNHAHLQSSYNKYGKSNFEFFLMRGCEIHELDYLECFFIEYFNSTNRAKGYNSDFGGNAQKRLSDETKKKISENNARYFLGKKRPEISERMKVRVITDEYRKNISKCKKGTKHKESTKMILSDYYKLDLGNRRQKQKERCNKKILNVETGETYESINKTSERIGVGVATVYRWLNNISKPKVQIKYA